MFAAQLWRVSGNSQARLAVNGIGHDLGVNVVSRFSDRAITGPVLRSVLATVLANPWRTNLLMCPFEGLLRLADDNDDDAVIGDLNTEPTSNAGASSIGSTSARSSSAR